MVRVIFERRAKQSLWASVSWEGLLAVVKWKEQLRRVLFKRDKPTHPDRSRARRDM